MDYLTAEFSVMVQVVLIDIVLAGDNAIVVAMAAAGTPVAIRQRVILYGIGLAVVMRIAFALLAVQMLQIVGLLFAGGLLLLWVCWKLFREIVSGFGHEGVEELAERGESQAPTKTMRQAVWQIMIADLSMSLDNVLAVAGAAREHPFIMALGLLLSIVLMAAAATFIARLIARFRWIAWIGLAAISYVAVDMLWEGGNQIYGVTSGVALVQEALAAAVPSATPPSP